MSRSSRTWGRRYQGQKDHMRHYHWGFDAYEDDRRKGVPKGPPYGSEAWKAQEAAKRKASGGG